jgi:hypothetical protein
MSERGYLAEGARSELAALKAVLDVAGIASEIGPPLDGCAPST